MKILLLFLWLIPIAINVYADKDGDKPNYLQVFILRAFCAVLHGHFFGLSNFGEYFPVLVFQLTSYWLIFELALNLVRKRELFHYDYQELDSGWTDGFFAWVYRKTKTHAYHVLAKFLAFVLMICSIQFILSK